MDQNYLSTTQAAEAQRSFITKTYGWMFAGLLVTGAMSSFMLSNLDLIISIIRTPFLFWGLIIAELGLVMILSAGVAKMSPAAATASFITYAALSGVTLSVVLLAYTKSSIAMTFYVTAATFGITAVYGQVTKNDLTSVGSLCFMLLIGFIIASLVNLFLRSTMIYWILTYAGIFIFVGLTAYDAQKLKLIAAGMGQADEGVRHKAAIIGALNLYLDFINLFILLLRLFGRRR